MSPIKLIAMDMDGTLLNEKQQISVENLCAIRMASEAGIHIAICSGRNAKDISYFVSNSGLKQCHILSLNGACCLDAPNMKPYAFSTIPDSAVDQAVSVLLSHDVTFACFQENRVIVFQSRMNIRKLNWGTHISRGDVNDYAYGIEALEHHRCEGICKIVYIDEDHAQRIGWIRQELQTIEGLQVTSSWSNNLELIPQGVSKGIAVQTLAERLGLHREQVMALGDYDNDLDMILYAGYGVAMGNASEHVLRAARYTTLANTQNGVAFAIRKYALAE